MRATSFGYGKKLDLSMSSVKSPAPNVYNLSREFEKTTNKPQGFTFGLGREKVVFLSSFGKMGSKLPGPGNYDIKNSSFSNISYSMRAKYQNPEEKYSNQKTPGPGSYDAGKIEGMRGDGKYVTARFRNYGNVVISPLNQSSPETAKAKKTFVPGPASYKLVDEFSQSQRFLNSKFRSHAGRSFSHQHRQTVQINKSNPGPGYYQLPSEF